MVKLFKWRGNNIEENHRGLAATDATTARFLIGGE
jgi:hypothetical protein